MLEIGTQLQNRYVIEELIGRGGMGAVYLAVDQKFSISNRVAIKETFYESPELAEAFEREARLLNSLHHPILPHVSDYFTEAGGNFLVMEYIEGEDLSEILKRDGSFALADVTRWTLELLDGLDYLHSQDPPIIHRDIKPNNLKLTSRGYIVLLDFGLAKEDEDTAHGERSIFGYSRRYSPLEQIEGVGTDARSDIFSLGATVYQLLTGRPPVDALARASAIVAGQNDPLQLASELCAEIPESVASVIHSALALNAEQRFISASAMRSALEHAVDPGVRAEPVSPVGFEILPNSSPAVLAFPALQAFKAETGKNAHDAAGFDAIPDGKSVSDWNLADRADDAVSTDDFPANELGSIDEAPAAGAAAYELKDVATEPLEKAMAFEPAASSRGQAYSRTSWQKAGIWLALISVGLFALAYGISRTGNATKAVENSAGAPALETRTAEQMAMPAPQVVESDYRPPTTRVKPASKPKTEASPAVETREVAAQPQPRSGMLPRRSAEPQNQAPRIVLPRPQRRAARPAEPFEPASSIEDVFTGETAAEARQNARRAWELRVLEEEDLRRERRQRRRRNRPQYIWPF